jgi:hypothetical protein
MDATGQVRGDIYFTEGTPEFPQPSPLLVPHSGSQIDAGDYLGERHDVLFVVLVGSSEEFVSRFSADN